MPSTTAPAPQRGADPPSTDPFEAYRQRYGAPAEHPGADPPPADPCPPDAVNRPRSSAELGGRYRGGLGTLRIHNGTDYDAVALLVQTPRAVPRRAIYIRANETGTFTQIPRGIYRLRFQLGSSWTAVRRFCDVAGTSEFIRPLDFEEREEHAGIEYSSYEVTLHPVAGGTAKTQSIPASAFILPPP